MKRLGLSRHSSKGVWELGSTLVEHLGVMGDSVAMTLAVTDFKRCRVKQQASRLLLEVPIGRLYVDAHAVRTFTGLCISLLLDMPLTRIYTRSLYDSLNRGRRNNQLRVRLNHQAISKLRFWKSLLASQVWRPIHPAKLGAAVHSDALDVGYGATLNFDVFNAGVPGLYFNQSV